jgi:hypothetical protein
MYIPTLYGWSVCCGPAGGGHCIPCRIGSATPRVASASLVLNHGSYLEPISAGVSVTEQETAMPIIQLLGIIKPTLTRVSKSRFPTCIMDWRD